MHNIKQTYDILNGYIGQKITFYTMSDFGFPCIVTCKLVSLTLKPYAQYNESLVLGYIPTGKRKAIGIRIHGNQSLIVWPGVVDVGTKMFNDPVTRDGVTITKSTYSCFSSDYTNEAIENTTEKPIVTLNTPEQVRQTYILDQDTINTLKAFVVNGEINENAFNPLMLTPRHIQENLPGVRVRLNY